MRCKNVVCPNGQFKVVCSPSSDAQCANCSKCSVGFFLSGCGGSTDGICQACTNKYEIQVCGAQQSNASVSYYVGAGDIGVDNCPWVCAESYYRSADTCKSCTVSSCAIGAYRTNCTSNADGTCASCSNLPENAQFTSAGSPFNADNCLWACNTNFFSSNTSVGVCIPCKMPGQCKAGRYLAPCTQTTDYSCQLCTAKRDHSGYVQGTACQFECNSGFFQNGSNCVPCSIDKKCGPKQRLVNCSSNYDTSCTSCLEGVEFLVLDSGQQQCKNCSKLSCKTFGTYLESCSPLADATCAACTLAQLNSFYTSLGSPDMNNCSWACNAGYTKSLSENVLECQACPPGTFSQQGNVTCSECPAGTFSPVVAGTSSLVCIPCSAGTFSAQTGATSLTSCKDCNLGMLSRHCRSIIL